MQDFLNALNWFALGLIAGYFWHPIWEIGKKIFYQSIIKNCHMLIPKLATDPPWVRGMTALERRGLWRVMEQIYNINIKPVLEKKYGPQTTGSNKASGNRRKR